MSVELLKVEFRIVALTRDEDGTPVGEQVLAEGAAYAAGLDDLPGTVRELVTEADQQPTSDATQQHGARA